MSFGDFTWTPAATQNVIAECWGAGGKGRLGSNAPDMGPGGGGGAYSRKAGIAVVSGVGESIRVGGPGGVPSNHESFFRNNLTVQAREGGNAAFHTAGAGGLASASVGTVKFDGGNGGIGSFGVLSAGGGGGSSASRSQAGATGGVPAGGTLLTNGSGAGGDGGTGGTNTPTGDGHVGLGPGGGGGGGGSATVTQNNPGDGAEGAVVIWQDLGVWPPFGQTPLATFGTPPSNPVRPPKDRKSGFVM